MAHTKRIIGIGGTNGSGKDTIGHILAKECGYLFISVTDMLRNECRSRGLEVSRENLRKISAEWRQQSGMGAPIDKALEVFQEASEQYEGVALASLRHPGEVDRIHELGGQVWWIDADSRLRYQRVLSGDRGRGSEDQKTFEEFMAEEAVEMSPPPGSPPTALNWAAVRDAADVTITNQGDLESLKSQIRSHL